MKNRRGMGFVGYSELDVLKEIALYSIGGGFKAVGTDTEIRGVGSAIWIPDLRTLYIRNILCLDRGALRQLLDYAKQMYGSDIKFAGRDGDRLRRQMPLQRLEKILL